MSGSLATFQMLSALYTKRGMGRVKHLVRLWMRPYPIYGHCDCLVHHSCFCHASNKRHRPRSRQLDRNRHFVVKSRVNSEFLFPKSFMVKIQAFVYHQVEGGSGAKRIAKSTGVWTLVSSREQKPPEGLIHPSEAEDLQRKGH